MDPEGALALPRPHRVNRSLECLGQFADGATLDYFAIDPHAKSSPRWFCHAVIVMACGAGA